MALVVADRARDTTTTTGTGTVTLSGTAPSGYQNFSVIGNGNTTYYTIVGGSEWEVGTGTYASSGPTLARTTVLASSNGGSAVSFSSGTKDVFVTYPADIATMLGNSATGTGSVVLSASPTLTGTLTAAAGAFSSTLTSTAHTVTSASATALAVGLNGATNSAFTVDSSTGLQVAGLKVTGAVTGGTVAVVATDSGSATNLTVNAKGTGTIGIGSVSTGAVTITPATTLSAALTYGGITLSNAVTGTGNMVLSASPTLTGTLTAATGTFSGLITASAGVSSTLTTDATSATTGSIITAGGISTQKALWVGTTSRHVGAATFDSTIASGAITSTGAVTGTRLMIGADSGASYLLNVSGSSTSSAVRAIVINTSNNAGAVTLLQVQNDATYALQMKIYSSTSASPNVGEIRCDGGNLTLGGQNTVGLTLGTSGAATFASSVTATLFTPTATGSNGLGLKGSNNPALYASTTELANWTTTAFNVVKDLNVVGNNLDVDGTIVCDSTIRGLRLGLNQAPDATYRIAVTDNAGATMQITSSLFPSGNMLIYPDAVGLVFAGQKVQFQQSIQLIGAAATKTATATGAPGQLSWDASYFYVCTATDTWKRVAITGGY